MPPSASNYHSGGISRVDCLACQHTIDDAAKICPYCGSDPKTGQKIVDTAAIMQEEFTPRRVSTSESLLEYARQRQGVVIAVSVIVAFIILAALHQYVTMRNQNAVSAAPAVPLTEVTDLSNQPDETKPQTMPELTFQYDGHPQTMRNFIVEAGAVPPPEVVAAQQAAAQAAAAAKQQAAPTGQQPPVNPGQLRPAAIQPGAAAPRPGTAVPPAPQPAPTRPPV